MSDRQHPRDEDGPVEGREPPPSGISIATVAYAAVGTITTGIGLLLLQVWINTGRIGVLETATKQEQTFGLERAAANATRVKELEARLDRLDDRHQAEMLRLSNRIDGVASVCDELRRQHAK